MTLWSRAVITQRLVSTALDLTTKQHTYLIFHRKTGRTKNIGNRKPSIKIYGIAWVKIPWWHCPKTHRVGQNACRIFLVQCVVDSGIESCFQDFKYREKIACLDIEHRISVTVFCIGIIQRNLAHGSARRV